MPNRPVITIDPAKLFGQPYIENTPTSVIAGAVWRGDPFDTVMQEYGLSLAEVVLACWWEAQVGRPYAGAWSTWVRRVGPVLAAGGDLVNMEEPPTTVAGGPRVGQLWEAHDKRWTVPRMLRVTFVGYSHATCVAWYPREVGRTDHGAARAGHLPVPAHGVERKVRIPVRNFDASGYRLVSDHSAVGGKPEGRPE